MKWSSRYSHWHYRICQWNSIWFWSNPMSIQDFKTTRSEQDEVQKRNKQIWPFCGHSFCGGAFVTILFCTHTCHTTYFGLLINILSEIFIFCNLCSHTRDNDIMYFSLKKLTTDAKRRRVGYGKYNRTPSEKFSKHLKCNNPKIHRRPTVGIFLNIISLLARIFGKTSKTLTLDFHPACIIENIWLEKSNSPKKIMFHSLH